MSIGQRSSDKNSRLSAFKFPPVMRAFDEALGGTDGTQVLRGSGRSDSKDSHEKRDDLSSEEDDLISDKGQLAGMVMNDPDLDSDDRFLKIKEAKKLIFDEELTFI